MDPRITLLKGINLMISNEENCIPSTSSDKKHIGYIENGINIDHIPQGNAWYVVKILNIFNSGSQTGVGLNLPSKSLGHKDLIKVENRILSKNEISAISLFCVGATLSVIKDYKVVNKTTLTIPHEVDDIILCPNVRCVSKEYTSKFKTSKNSKKQICVQCHYCEQTFLLDKIKNYKI